MKFFHLADLHFGKSIHGVPLLENGDQPVWVERFLALAEETRPDAVVIAGDIYDRSAPSGDAVALFDHMATALTEMGVTVMAVAGNHDSGQRLSFGGSLLAKQKLHIAGVLSPRLPCVTLSDGHGPVNFWLMPYIFPALAAQKLGDDGIRDYDTAVRRLLTSQGIDFTQRNVLVAHQNVAANGIETSRGGSESMVGGIGQVDYSAFDGFDYAALGHIHAAYSVGRTEVRYAGSPLCYHFDETKQPAKGPLLVELGAKGTAPTITRRDIPPLHPMRRIRGSFEELQQAELQNAVQGEYIQVILTDRRLNPSIDAFFRNLFEKRGSTVLEIKSEYSQFGALPAPSNTRPTEEKAIEALFMDFYTQRRGGLVPTPQEQELLRFAGEQVRHTGYGKDALERQAKALQQFALEQEAEK
ncbi:MAG: exonuclease SbcCD subunit D [Oscillospiraceae bacterium]|nr:exonuclease SbcCD subunit D [Oscillospiraceae bacterium]